MIHKDLDQMNIYADLTKDQQHDTTLKHSFISYNDITVSNNIKNNNINKSNAILAFILGAILIIIGAILCGIEFSNFNSIPVGIALIVMGAFSSVVCTILLTDENTDNETKTKEKVDDDE
jgi:anaerobic C4-dicarboxylate transporter